MMTSADFLPNTTDHQTVCLPHIPRSQARHWMLYRVDRTCIGNHYGWHLFKKRHGGLRPDDGYWIDASDWIVNIMDRGGNVVGWMSFSLYQSLEHVEGDNLGLTVFPPDPA